MLSLVVQVAKKCESYIFILIDSVRDRLLVPSRTPLISISTTESELNAAVLESMDMMLTYYIMKVMRLTMELPMKLYVDNKGTVALANNWSVGGRTRHIGAKTNFLRSLKEMGFIHVLWKKGSELLPNIGTKNVEKREFVRNTNKIMCPKLSDEGVGINYII